SGRASAASSSSRRTCRPPSPCRSCPAAGRWPSRTGAWSPPTARPASPPWACSASRSWRRRSSGSRSWPRSTRTTLRSRWTRRSRSSPPSLRMRREPMATIPRSSASRPSASGSRPRGRPACTVVLDLQPGTTDFLTQAQLYEELLLQPHVGLALDAEWRLAAGQRHLEQIGSVSGAEVNETAQWLADLTAEHELPQKVFILHQFSLAMISDRQDIDASRPELAMVLHADGHGTREDKLSTWNTLQQGLPEGIGMAWKNFYDEDTPTFTPEETYDLEPRPWFVSYQ